MLTPFTHSPPFLCWTAQTTPWGSAPLSPVTSGPLGRPQILLSACAARWDPSQGEEAWSSIPAGRKPTAPMETWPCQTRQPYQQWHWEWQAYKYHDMRYNMHVYVQVHVCYTPMYVIGCTYMYMYKETICMYMYEQTCTHAWTLSLLKNYKNGVQSLNHPQYLSLVCCWICSHLLFRSSTVSSAPTSGALLTRSMAWLACFSWLASKF